MRMLKNLGLALIVLRGLRGWSQAAVAREARIGKSQLSKYETGSELPKLDSLAKVLTALGVTLSDLAFVLELLDRSVASPQGPQPRFPGMPLLSERVGDSFAVLLREMMSLHTALVEDRLRTELERLS